MGLESNEIIGLVREGVPAIALDHLARAMRVPTARLLMWMDWPATTVKRKIRARSILSKSEGEQILLAVRLISQVQQMINESGSPEGFDAPSWLANWLAEPNPALGHLPPGEYMDTTEGLNLLNDILARMRSGAYM